MRDQLRIAAPVLGLLLLGCDRVPTRPDISSIPVRFTLTLSSAAGDRDHPVGIHARVTNVGFRPISYSVGCTSPGIRLSVRAPDRGNVVDPCTECPIAVCPACADLLLSLMPGQSIESSAVFTGTLQHCDGPYAGPAGEYTVEATFWSRAADGRDSLSITRAETFSWSAPVAP